MSTRTKEERLEIANTILAQLGGNRFKIMTGAKNFSATDQGLQFTFGRSKRFTVNLDDDDTYTVQVHQINIRAKSADRICVETHSLSDVYWDQLQRVFTKFTGLDTHL